MERSRYMKTIGALLLAVALCAGCGKAKDDRAGQKHGPGDGHGHGAKKAAAVVATAKCPHEAARDLCFICDPALRDKSRLWCKEHNRYEDRCWPCHPDAQDKKRAFCDEHGLYEDECFLCDPSRNAGAQKSAGPVLMCGEHGVPEAECGICRPDVAGKLKPGEGLKVRLPSSESARIVGRE